MVEMLPVNSCQPCPWNPRVIAEDCPDMQSLTESIRVVGVLSPILVRPLGLVYQILAGERRWRAACAAGLTEIPAIVREVDDRAAIEITVTENLERKDLTPLEEAAGIQSLLDAGWGKAAIAARLGRGPYWVARRARLSTLAPAWREAIKADPVLSQWTAGHLEIVARLAPESQDALLPSFRGRFPVPTIDALAKYCTRESMDPSAAPWNGAEAKMDRTLPRCGKCPKRASEVEYLFSPEELLDKDGKSAGDRCLDPVCWGKKLIAYCQHKASLAKKKYGDKLVYVNFEGKKLLDVAAIGGWSVEVVKKGDDGAVPAICVSDCTQVGEIVWVLAPQRASGNNGHDTTRNDEAAATENEPAEKLDKKEIKKKRKAIASFLDLVGDNRYRMSIETMLPIFVAYSFTSSSFVFPFGSESDDSNAEMPCYKAAKLLGQPEHADALRVWLWVLLRRLIDSKFSTIDNATVGRAWEELEWLVPTVMGEEFTLENFIEGK